MEPKKRRKRHSRGHRCWCCGEVKANEAFSGKGHGRHLCRACERLGKEQVEFRQAVRDIDRCFTWGGFPRHHMRAVLDRFGNDPRLDVREYAERRLQEAETERVLSLNEFESGPDITSAIVPSEDVPF